MTDLRVFISYSHDSEPHRDAVLELAQQLRGWGIDVQLDRFVLDPPEGWPRWMMSQIDAADLVILVCTDTYRRRFEGQETPGKGKGVTFEGLLGIQHLHDASTRNQKFIPVIFGGATEADVPLVLRPYTRYSLPGQLDSLYRRLTNQPEIVAAPLGPRKIMPPRGAAVPAGPSMGSTPSTGAVARPPQAAAPVLSAGGRNLAVTPQEALQHLLLGLFVSGEEFRRWIARGPDGARLVAEFPGGSASAAAMISDGLDILQRRGYLERDFFERLAAEFARRRHDIELVAAAWNPAFASTHGGLHFGSVSGSVHITAGGDIIAGDKHVTHTCAAPLSDEARHALAALRTALATRGGDLQKKIDRALDDAAEELANPAPDRGEIAEALARVLKLAARVAPNLASAPEVAAPLSRLTAWLGPDGARLPRT